MDLGVLLRILDPASASGTSNRGHPVSKDGVSLRGSNRADAVPKDGVAAGAEKGGLNEDTDAPG